MVASKNKSLWCLCAFLLAIAFCLLWTSVASAQGADEALEREAQTIDKMIMCPVCPAETIDQAQVEISFQMRAVIREMLAEGRTRDEILDYFVDRYGADILAAPPKSGSNLVAWILPVVGVAAALVGVFFVIRSMTGSQRNDAAPASAPAAAGETPHSATGTVDPELLPYLEIADRLLDSRRAVTRRTTSPGPSTEGPAPPDAGDTEDFSSSQEGETSG